MKKLMFAMAIAATVGFAQAEIVTTTFDDLTVSNKFDFSAVGYTDWSATGSEGRVDDTMVTAYDKNAEDYDAANGDNFLALEGVQNLAKNINTAIGDGLYIDTMVKFSAMSDGAPEPGNEDKLVVWLKEIEGANGGASTYKLMVTAGSIDIDNGEIVKQDYETDATVLPDKWYNLKVKAIANVDAQGNLISGLGVSGFVVFIDGVAAKTDVLPATGDGAEEAFNSKYIDVVKEEYALFPSLIDTATAGAAEITQLAFSGSGSIDTVAAFQGDCDPDDDEPTTWPTGDDLDKVAGTTAAATFGISGTLANVDAKVFATWASGNGGIAYADKGTVTINEKCFLLNIANSSTAADIEAAEETAKEAIKITAISFNENGDVVLTYPATYGNGKIVVEGSLQLPAEWHDKVDTDQFFRTKLVLDEVAAPAVGD